MQINMQKFNIKKDFTLMRNTRIVNLKLVFVSGIPREMATEEILRSD